MVDQNLHEQYDGLYFNYDVLLANYDDFIFKNPNDISARCSHLEDQLRSLETAINELAEKCNFERIEPADFTYKAASLRNNERSNIMKKFYQRHNVPTT